MEAYVHGAMKGSACIDQSEWHFTICIGSQFGPQRCLKLVFGGNQYLVIPRETI